VAARFTLPQRDPRHPCETRREACLVLSQGRGAHFFLRISNQPRIISSSPGNATCSDRQARHASIIDACRLSFAEVKKFKHDDMGNLEYILKESGNRGKLVVVDGVYSMEGDIAPLPDIVKVCRKYGRGLCGRRSWHRVLGKTGRGTVEHFGLEKEVDIIMGTYSKSLASIGGFVAASEEVIHYVKHTSRPLIFSASPRRPRLRPSLRPSISSMRNRNGGSGSGTIRTR